MSSFRTRKQESYEPEMGLISSLLQSPEKVLPAIKEAGIQQEHFMSIQSQLIFRSVMALTDAGKPVDSISVTQQMDMEGTLDNAGGAAAISEHLCFIPTALNYDYYLGIVKRNATQRMVEKECRDLLEEVAVLDTAEKIASVAMKAHKGSDAFAMAAQDYKKKQSSDLMKYVEQSERVFAGGEPTNKLYPTPWPTLTWKSGGTASGELTGVVASTSAGKSLILKQFVTNLNLNHSMPAVIFSGEMTYDEYMNRIVCDVGNVNFRSLRDAKLSEADQKGFMRTIHQLHKSNLHIYDPSGIRFTDAGLEGMIRSLHRNEGLKVVGLDMLQHVRYTGKSKLRTDEEIGYVSSMLKNLALELGLQIFVACKANKEGDVRNSGESEYDFDNCINIIVKKDMRSEPPRITTEKLMITKWRNGERGYSFKVRMEGEHCRIVEE